MLRLERTRSLLLAGLGGWLLLAAFGPTIAGTEAPEDRFSARQLRRIRRLGPLPPLQADPTNRVSQNEDAARLGQRLFFDPALSRDGSVSCATCHQPELDFSDGRSLAQGLEVGERRSPSLVNVAYHRWFFWDGRADSLWSQALGPLENPIEMGGDRLGIVRYLVASEELREPYEKLFGPLPVVADEPASARPVPDEPEHPHHVAWLRLPEDQRDAIDRAFANVGKLLAAYQERLVRRDAPFDRWLASLDGGPEAPLSDAALKGLELFIGKAQCTLCHNGPLLSDLEFHNTSAPPLGGGDPEDPGRYLGVRKLLASPFHAGGPHSDDREGPTAKRTQALRDSSESWGEFKTPSLRNLSKRQPLMHQGQFKDLRAVLQFYATLDGATGRNHHAEAVLNPFDLDESEMQALLAFFETLEGEPIPDKWRLAPQGMGNPAPQSR